ncbi:MAG: L-histidine N(alpha)-methyltransferase [Sphingomonadaceae bacterium]
MYNAPLVVTGADPAFRADVLRGLRARPRAIPARWLYDQRGSELFEEITLLPEYYPTRTEMQILEQAGPGLAAQIGPNHAVIEFGAGAATKTRTLLRWLKPAAWVPIDISGEFLRQSAETLGEEFPDLHIHPVEADFTHPVALPAAIAGLPRLGFFPGSTIGNLTAERAVDLLRDMRATLGLGARLLIGMDRLKSPDVLIAAYDDAQGITADFNRNLLVRINRELDGGIPVDAFRHVALWNDAAARIEMHLEAMRDVRFSVAGEEFAISTGETIHTENSHKYSPRSARFLLRAGGFIPAAEWTDDQDQFALLLAEAQETRHAP